MYIFGLTKKEDSGNLKQLVTYKFDFNSGKFKKFASLNLAELVSGHSNGSKKAKEAEKTISKMPDLKCVEIQNRKILNSPKLVGTPIARCLLYKNDLGVPQIASVFTFTTQQTPKVQDIQSRKTSPFLVEQSKIKI